MSPGLLRNPLEWNNNQASSALAEAVPVMCSCQSLMFLCQINVTFNLCTFNLSKETLISYNNEN